MVSICIVTQAGIGDKTLFTTVALVVLFKKIDVVRAGINPPLRSIPKRSVFSAQRHALHQTIFDDELVLDRTENM